MSEMIYTFGFFVAFFGLIILLLNPKKLFSKFTLLEKFGFIVLCLGLILPMIYGFINGMINR